MREGRGGKTAGKIVGAVVLAAVVAGCATTQRLQRAKVETARANIANLNVALALYYSDTGSYPPERRGLVELLHPVAPGMSQYLTGIPADPWGRPYRYRLDGNFPRIDSAGPDGIFGTGDDVHD